jgi:hypothetical protein
MKFAVERNAGASSKIAPEEAEFSELVGDSFEGTVARFANKPGAAWYRSVREPDLILAPN